MIMEGKKTIEIRKGNAFPGKIAVFLSGRNYLRLSIRKTETGLLSEVIRQDNFRQIIPTAEKLQDALNYLRNLYTTDKGLFTAYYVGQIET